MICIMLLLTAITAFLFLKFIQDYDVTTAEVLLFFCSILFALIGIAFL